MPAKHATQESQLDSELLFEEKFSLTEAARILGGVDPSYVGKLMSRGKLGFYQVGTRKMAGKSHLLEYMAAIRNERTEKQVN